MRINEQIYRAMNNVFMRNCLMRRWTSNQSQDKYSELAKQAFNGIITYLLASEEEHAGNKIDWTKFPKIMIYRQFQKAYVLYDISEITVEEIFKMGQLDENSLNKTTKEIIEEQTNADFADEICGTMGSREERIFKAATKIATYIELLENKVQFNGNYGIKANELIQSLRDFEDIEGFKTLSNTESLIFKMLQTISRLRNQNRWTAYARSLDCSVLGHLMDTAVFAYFMGLEEDPDDEEEATKLFFIGLFHDIPEAWTKDIPSPIKDRIPGFRAASEKYEMIQIRENMYNIMPKYLATQIKKVMMEDSVNKNVKTLLKGADYLSASSECLRQVIGGSKDFNFLRATLDVQDKMNEGKAKLTPAAISFYNYLLNKIKESPAIFY